MKKINKISNKDRSKELLEKMFERIENENKEVMELFEHIIVNVPIPEFKLSCLKGDRPLLDIGLSEIEVELKLVLTKNTLLTVVAKEAFLHRFS
jgi:hypothetical protein